MGNDLDKDIEILKKYIEEQKEIEKSFNLEEIDGGIERKGIAQAIENVLLELETYKKIADEIENMFSEECTKLGSYEKDNSIPEKERIAGGINILNKLRKRLDWAKSEVENGKV